MLDLTTRLPMFTLLHENAVFVREFLEVCVDQVSIADAIHNNDEGSLKWDIFRERLFNIK